MTKLKCALCNPAICVHVFFIHMAIAFVQKNTNKCPNQQFRLYP